MAHVLGAEERAEGEAVEEVAGGKEASDRADSEASLLLEESRDVSLLWYAISSHNSFTPHLSDDVQVLPARELVRHRLQVVVYCAPSRYFLLRVLQQGWQAPMLVLVGQTCDHLPPLPVSRVMEPRMIALQLRSCVECAGGNGIELGDMEGKPGDELLVEDEHVSAVALHFLEDGGDPIVPHVTVEVDGDVKDRLASHARTRLDPRQVDALFLEGPQEAIQSARGVLDLS
mmetsp:Transcript_14782/g.50388  ORF Transcript_14782/g.50388 Transcript_14782/m.50388 type:complete len:230 (+) Transcript_14782:590-1279(+)